MNIVATLTLSVYYNLKQVEMAILNEVEEMNQSMRILMLFG